jgi:hypothetical protein
MKSENNKENHKNCQNRGLRARFSKSKDPMVRVLIFWLLLVKQFPEIPVKI